MGNVLPFPCAAIVRHDVAKPVRSRRKVAPKASAALHMSPQQEEQIDKLAEILVERAKRRIAAWQAQEGMPDEEAALIGRLEQLSYRREGLNNLTLYRMDALLTSSGWRDDDV